MCFLSGNREEMSRFLVSGRGVMIGRLGSPGEGNSQAKVVECRRLGVGVGKVKNQLARGGRGTGKNKEKRYDRFRDGRYDPVMMRHIVVGPGALPILGIDRVPGLVGVLENECIALVAPKTEVLIVGREIKQVAPKVNPECPGAFVFDFDRQVNVGNAVLFLDDGRLRPKF